jgi:hypothetical protein
VSHSDATSPNEPRSTSPAYLSEHRDSILYQLGQISADIRHFSDGLKVTTETIKEMKQDAADSSKELSGRFDSGINDLKASLKIIQDKVLVAETQVTSAFYTSKWFLGAACLVGGWLLGHYSWLVRILGPNP